MIYSDESVVLKQLLGKGVKILNIIINDVIQEEFVIVDVEYINETISTNEIFYINATDLKRTTNSPNRYVFNINQTLGFQERKLDLNQNIILSIFTEPNGVLPVRINPILKHQEEDFLINYFAIIIKYPFTSLMTPYKYFNKSVEIYQFSDILNIKTMKMENLTDIYNNALKVDIKHKEDVEIYEKEKNKIKAVSIVEHVDEFKKIITDNPNREVAYVIDFRKITPKSLKGVIYISENRVNPWSVLFYPTIKFKISEDELSSIKSFLTLEYMNYVNFLNLS
jgi:hypothetical protein